MEGSWETPPIECLSLRGQQGIASNLIDNVGGNHHCQLKWVQNEVRAAAGPSAFWSTHFTHVPEALYLICRCISEVLHLFFFRIYLLVFPLPVHGPVKGHRGFCDSFFLVAYLFSEKVKERFVMMKLNPDSWCLGEHQASCVACCSSTFHLFIHKGSDWLWNRLLGNVYKNLSSLMCQRYVIWFSSLLRYFIDLNTADY